MVSVPKVLKLPEDNSEVNLSAETSAKTWFNNTAVTKSLGNCLMSEGVVKVSPKAVPRFINFLNR